MFVRSVEVGMLEQYQLTTDRSAGLLWRAVLVTQRGEVVVPNANVFDPGMEAFTKSPRIRVHVVDVAVEPPGLGQDDDRRGAVVEERIVRRCQVALLGKHVLVRAAEVDVL